MLTRLAHLLRAEVVGFTATEGLVDLVEDGREGIRLLLIHFPPKTQDIFITLGMCNTEPDCMPFTELLYINISRYLGGNTSLSFSEAGSPPMPQCVLGIS